MIVIRTKGRTIGDAGLKGNDGFARQEASRAAKEYAQAATRHPLVALGDGLTPIEYARAILVDAGKLTTRNGVPWLDDACATPRSIMLAANRVLKGQGLPQIGKRPEWLV